jgi:hypothetical protein
MQSRQTQSYITQWAAQFFSAAELVRRGYLVSLPLGNAHIVDIHVQSPEGIHFTVDVKGQSTKNFWLIQRREPDPSHFFILVYLPKKLQERPEFFLLTSSELMRRRHKYEEESIKRGRYNDATGGVNWSTPLDCKDCWSILPN